MVRISSGDYGRGTLKEKPVETNPKPGTSLNKPLNLNKRKSARASSPVRENSSPTFEWDYTDVIEPHFTTLLLSAQYNEFVGPIVNEQIRQENKNTTGDKGEEIERSVSKKQIRDVTLDAITYNNLDYKKYLQSHIDEIIESSQPRTFKPFLGFVDNDDIDNKSTSVIEGKNEHPSLYLGFDNKIEKSPTIIYFSIIENLFYEHIESALDFYYFSGISKQWKRLDNIDETRYLQKKGYLKLFLPSDFHNFSLFGRNLYWIKIVDAQGVFHQFNQQKKSLAQIKFPRLQGIYLNTVECVNASKVQDELLTRQSDTQFLFSKKPLSSTIKDKENQEKIWVREDIGLNDSLENKNFTNSPSVDNLRLVRDSNGNIIESWVLWQERSDLEFSRPNDRHYVIDRKEGILFFGNDINGKAVPAQNNNIVKANFTVGGGKQGNIGLGEIKTLKSLVPLIDSVINTGNGEGGSNMQTAQSGKDRWPSMIENRGQAVTAVDFENIIKNKFVSLSRIKCFSTTNSKGGFSPGEVLVVIIPESFDNSGNLLGKPYPSIELLDNIRDYLMSRSSNVLISNNKLNISGPIYFKVTVSAEIFVKNLDDIVTVEKLALEAIKNFLHPTKGGFDGYGWEFGKSLCASDLYMLFSRLEGVEYVTNISTNIKFDEDNFNENISVGVNEDIVEEKFMDVFVTPITDSKHSNSNYNRLPPSALLYSNDNHNLKVKYDKGVMEQRGEEEERGPD